MFRDRTSLFDDIDAFVDEFMDAVDYAAVALTPPGNCNWARHSALQAPVHRLCDQRPRACSGAMTGCRSTSKHILRNALCASARRAINQECYAGGDTGHRIAENQARIAGAACRERWNTLGCGRRAMPRNVRRFV
ncbi:MAG: hypothetical protein E6Q88_12460 [Lysobacteraceae bacterium]|nr:MAG: hypothetical protein E6Q88_12460 [Xanthomonadaceae bacterium]